MIFAATGISVALKRSVTVWQVYQLMLGMSSLHYCAWWLHHTAKHPSPVKEKVKPKVKQSAHLGLKILNNRSSAEEQSTSQNKYMLSELQLN